MAFTCAVCCRPQKVKAMQQSSHES